MYLTRIMSIKPPSFYKEITMAQPEYTSMENSFKFLKIEQPRDNNYTDEEVLYELEGKKEKEKNNYPDKFVNQSLNLKYPLKTL